MNGSSRKIIAAGAAMLFGVAICGTVVAAEDTSAQPAPAATAGAAAPAPADMKPQAVHHMHMHAGSAHIKAIQEALNHEGAKLSVDGHMGKHTREALKSFQSAHGLKATGHADGKTLEALGLKPAKSKS